MNFLQETDEKKMKNFAQKSFNDEKKQQLGECEFKCVTLGQQSPVERAREGCLV